MSTQQPELLKGVLKQLKKRKENQTTEVLLRKAEKTSKSYISFPSALAEVHFGTAILPCESSIYFIIYKY